MASFAANWGTSMGQVVGISASVVHTCRFLWMSLPVTLRVPNTHRKSVEVLGRYKCTQSRLLKNPMST